MSDDSDDPRTEPIKVGSVERRRAAIALSVLGVCAVVFVTIMVYLLGSRGNNPSDRSSRAVQPPGPAVTVTGGSQPVQPSSGAGSQPPTSGSGTDEPSHHPGKSVPATDGPTTCGSSSPCALHTDVGDAIGALNDYRTAHGAPKVAGKVTKSALRCALANGDESSCPSGYFWEPVGRSGKQVIDKIAAQSSGSSWLLSTSVKKFDVGWVYIPSSKSYEVVLVAPGT